MRRVFALGFVYLSYVACAGGAAQPETVVAPEPRATATPLPSASAGPVPEPVVDAQADLTAEEAAGKSKPSETTKGSAKRGA
ncbi:MAG TPA: hypothetical protein VEX18_04685, partial [Polyangiaceae bacterium]|nr:hypothetical protein [Polyangiaceae bacterium]